MFLKDKVVAQGTATVTKKVIDWGAVFGALFWGVVLIVVLASI